ncbi:MAG: hypothetical protein KKG69_10775 [Alphaproteobacteria bacterium]|uniref:hypothetical protein n=1 Tax=Brevundimonas mediterranea TaxID=74329 RepID=UPI0011FC4CAF|nr:hypothetical protein [Brevundimonas mediterranea]MBU2231745.1 hypothetical protein [Alphaproteobacteria bacterium]TAJ43292.1 MAG: hypothetical protein EPO54_07965 [Brevundimonas sp.]
MWRILTHMDNNGNILLAPDARSLILDLFVAHGGPHFTSAELIRAGALFDHSGTAMRTALTRLRREGRVEALGRGVYGPGRIDDPWRRRIDHWRSAPSRRTAWTGAWLMATAKPSSVSRTAWRATLRALDVEGFRQIPQGLFVRPDTLQGGIQGCRLRLMSYGASGELLTGRFEELDPASTNVARSLWDVPGLAARRQNLLDLLMASQVRLPRLSNSDAAREALTIGRAAVRAIVRDPLLPREWEAGPSLDDLVGAMAPYNALGREVWMTSLGR